MNDPDREKEAIEDLWRECGVTPEQVEAELEELDLLRRGKNDNNEEVPDGV